VGGEYRILLSIVSAEHEDVVHVHLTALFYDVTAHIIEVLLGSQPILGFDVQRALQGGFLVPLTLLVVNEPHVESETGHFFHDRKGVSEPITYADTF
jgi:hypothetical protein